MGWKVKDLKEFIEGLDDDMDVVVESIISGEERYCSSTADIYSSVDWNSKEKLLVIVPKEVEICNAVEGEEVSEFADYLIENASESFKYQDRELLEQVLKQYGKFM